MKRFVYLLLTVCLCATACKKEESGLYDSPAQASDYEAEIKAYIAKHDIKDVERDPSGIYYKIINPGTGQDAEVIGPDDIPTINFTLTSLDGEKVLNSSNGIPTNFNGRPLKDHIAGWQLGLRKIKKGGIIWLFIPPQYAFGDAGISGLVPANTALFSELKLIDF
ncbi:FKBP-type peptidyl-prolyl cis-trans isomerase [Chitinophaga caeni]|nr:FKBP-type peptidyl-prolyl cis-trans isomerase [Chitinophaga caeni]